MSEQSKWAAGREMDALVAEKVMGWTGLWEARGKGKGYLMAYPPVEQVAGIDAERWPVPAFSTDIAAAWAVVEKLESLGYWCQTRTPFGQGKRNDGYWAGFTPHLETGWNGRPDYSTNAETLPLAICRAALETLADKESEEAK